MEHALAATGFKTGTRQFILNQLQRLTDRTEELESPRSGLDPTAVAHKKLIIKHHFKTRHGVAYGWLRHPEGMRGTGNILLLHYRIKYSQ